MFENILNALQRGVNSFNAWNNEGRNLTKMRRDKNVYEKPTDNVTIAEKEMVRSPLLSPLSEMGMVNLFRENTYRPQIKMQSQPQPSATPMPQMMPVQPQTQGTTDFADIITKANPQFKDKYSNNTFNVVPELFDAVMKADIPVGDEETAYGMPMKDYMRRLALELGSRESYGGRVLRGDTNLPEELQAYGAYHVRPGVRKDISYEDAMDFDKMTQYLINEMIYNKNRGVKPNQFLRGGKGLKNWNFWSGYAGEGQPGYGGMTYDDDIVREATTSSYLRKR